VHWWKTTYYPWSAQPERTSRAHNPKHVSLRALCAASDMQALLSSLLVMPPPGSGAGPPPVAGAALLHEHWLLWSTLPRGDTAALHRLATAALLPAVRAAVQPSLGTRLGGTLWRAPCRRSPAGASPPHAVQDVHDPSRACLTAARTA